MRRWMVGLVLGWVAVSAGAMDVAGVRVEPKVMLEQQVLKLNGAGVRTKYFIKVYVAALYVPEPSNVASRVVMQPGPKRIQLALLRGLSSRQWIDAVRQGLEKNNSPQALVALHPQQEAFENIIEAMGEGHAGDGWQLDFIPGVGTQIRMNGIRKGAPIAGEDFFRALLLIWLGNQPAQDSLKRDLLGGGQRQ